MDESYPMTPGEFELARNNGLAGYDGDGYWVAVNKSGSKSPEIRQVRWVEKSKGVESVVDWSDYDWTGINDK